MPFLCFLYINELLKVNYYFINMTTKNVNKDPVSQNKKKTVNKEGLYEMTTGERDGCQV